MAFDVGLELGGHVLGYADAAYRDTRTSDGISLRTFSAGPLVLVATHQLRLGGTINASYVWFDRATDTTSVGQFGLGMYLQGGVDLARVGDVTLSFDLRGGSVFMSSALYPSARLGFSARF